MLISSGQSRRNLYAGIIGSSVVSLGFIIGIQWGVSGIAWSYVISVYLPLLPMQKYCSRGTSVEWYDMFVASRGPIILSVVLLLVGCWGRFMLVEREVSPIQTLLMVSIVFAIIALVGAICSYRKELLAVPFIFRIFQKNENT